ncbi:hypothetical protein M758_3G148700 [Ceratodon purpureus]|uniref:Uncharacterized protein n=1 Tax=Ceratodon purpureus TaxID=3225 RepID=A0A8T0IL28_CERPU|nr:hypothetical protein KC19_3G147400 [Ceratodon purpureus]KAG0623106.1 hypothetical protein M758_3G148700 [Ceratodon purpureus]
MMPNVSRPPGFEITITLSHHAKSRNSIIVDDAARDVRIELHVGASGQSGQRGKAHPSLITLFDYNASIQRFVHIDSSVRD